MTTRAERLEARLQKLRDEEAQLEARRKETEKQLSTEERKRRTRQAIVAWTTLESVITRLNQPVPEMETMDDVMKFLDRYVVGNDNRRVWGLEVQETGTPPKKKKPAKTSKPDTGKKPSVPPDMEGITEQTVQGTIETKPHKSLRESVSQDDLEKEFL